MKKLTIFALLGLAACFSASPLLAADEQLAANAKKEKGCKNVTGKAAWNLIATPNDILGRVLGPTTGSLKAAVTAYLTALTPQPDGSLVAKSKETWSFGAKDMLVFDGSATFTPVAGQAVGTVLDSLILTVESGTGEYLGATGTIKVVGIGYNLFGPEAGPGKTFFDVTYQGNICTK